MKQIPQLKFNLRLDPSDLYQFKGKIPQVIQTGQYAGNDLIYIEFDDGSWVAFTHDQDCCEDVEIEDVNGEFEDLIGTPLLVIDERTNEGDTDWGTETWTFYTYRSNKGTVDVRWHGSSNGYYSEGVNIYGVVV